MKLDRALHRLRGYRWRDNEYPIIWQNEHLTEINLPIQKGAPIQQKVLLHVPLLARTRLKVG